MKEKLIEIGFTEYEAKSYISLLLKNPSTAYEIAKNGAIPTSKVYEVLNKLVEKKIILSFVENNKKKYIPKDPDEMIDIYKSNMNNTLEGLRHSLNNISKDNDISYIWNIVEYDYLFSRAKKIISEAQEEILLSVWQIDLEEIYEDLKKSKEKGVKIATVLYGENKISIGQSYKHPIVDTIYAEKGGRGFVLVADSQEVLFGKIDNKEVVHGANSMNEGFVAMAEDYVKHDIYIMKIVKRFENILTKKFGENYHLLRDVFSDNELES